MKKLQFILLALFALSAAASADLGIHLFKSLAQGTSEALSRGIAAPLLQHFGIVSGEEMIPVFCVLLLFTGAFFAGSIACAASRALQSKMANDDDEAA